jgi:hypothetical protein
MNETAPSTNEINVTRLIDDGPLTGFQIGTIFVAPLSARWME